MEEQAKKFVLDAFTALPENVRTLFIMYADDAGNWSGQPLVGGNVTLLGLKQDRGLLTHLKRAGLVTTFTEDGNTWLDFTEVGREVALSVSRSFTVEFGGGQ